VRLALDQLPAHVGKSLGSTGWQVVDQATIDAFARATGDRQWIHVEPERAAAGPFGTTIAHGYLTLSLCAPLLMELLEVEGAGMTVNYGLDRVRFPAPVRAGARVRGRGELIVAEAHPWGVQAVARVTVEVEGGERPACVADTVSRFYRDDRRGGS
jgi:acyl dehydratase